MSKNIKYNIYYENPDKVLQKKQFGNYFMSRIPNFNIDIDNNQYDKDYLKREVKNINEMLKDLAIKRAYFKQFEPSLQSKLANTLSSNVEQ